MKLRYILYASPLILAINIYSLTVIASLLRQPSDAAVFAGVLFSCLLIGANAFIIKFILSKIKS
jgi:hypothetical protein